MTDFDEYVSLGYNCEVAWQLRRAHGDDRAGFFNWRITDTSQLVALLQRRFEGLLKPDQIGPGEAPGMIRDLSYHYQIHSPFETTDFASDPDFIAKLDLERGKMSHLAERFKNPEGRRCYFLKPRFDLTQGEADEVMRCLDRCSPDYVLVVLRAEGAPITGAKLFDRRLSFVTTPDQTDHGDDAGYDRIFAEFPLSERVMPVAA